MTAPISSSRGALSQGNVAEDHVFAAIVTDLIRPIAMVGMVAEPRVGVYLGSQVSKGMAITGLVASGLDAYQTGLRLYNNRSADPMADKLRLASDVCMIFAGGAMLFGGVPSPIIATAGALALACNYLPAFMG